MNRAAWLCWALLLPLVALAALLGCSGSLPDESSLREAPPAELVQAVARLEARVQDDPEDAEALRRLALAEIRLGRASAAVVHARAATRVEPFAGPSFRVLGEAFEAAGNLPQAEAAYAQTLVLEPGLLPTYLRLAHLQAGSQQWSKALRTLNQTLKRFPEDFEALLQKADLLLQMGQLDPAADAIRDARARDPAHPAALRLHVQLLARQGRGDTAIALARQGLAANPGDRALLVLLAQVSRARGDWAAAEDTLNRMRAAAPLSPEERLLVVDVLTAQGRDADARTALEGLAREQPDFLPALVRLGERAIRAGRTSEGLEIARRAITLAPQGAEAHYWAAAALFVLDDTTQGESALETAERLDPARPAVRLLRVGRLLAARRLEAAGNALEQLAKDVPDLLALGLYQSERLVFVGDLRAAAQALERLPPDFAPAHVQFAWLRIAYLQGQWAEAERLAAHLAAEPLLGWRATYLRAGALLQLGRWSEGAKVIAPSLEGPRRRVDVTYLGGYLKLLQGDREGARRIFLAGQALAPGHPLMVEALSRMALDSKDWSRARELLQQGLKAPGSYRKLFLERLARVGQGLRDGALAQGAQVQALDLRQAMAAGELPDFARTFPAAAALDGAFLPDFGLLGGR